MSKAPQAGPPVVMLMGPTAVGKTELAMTLVEQLPLDIVSVDSAMVYRGMDIGTGKPSTDELERAPHRLIDIRDPEQSYSAAEFRDDAVREIAAIHSNGRIPLLVGGTGLYFRALTRGLSALPRADAPLRRQLAEEGERLGWAAMHRRLAAVDAQAAGRIHPNDPQRIQRALEVHALTGRAMSELQTQGGSNAVVPSAIRLVLAPAERSTLHQRIATRFDVMLAAGLVEEVERLCVRPGVHRDLPAMRAVGYRQVLAYLHGETDRGDMRERAVAATRQLARRQLTWLRSETAATWHHDGRNLVHECRRRIEAESGR